MVSQTYLHKLVPPLLAKDGVWSNTMTILHSPLSTISTRTRHGWHPKDLGHFLPCCYTELNAVNFVSLPGSGDCSVAPLEWNHLVCYCENVVGESLESTGGEALVKLIDKANEENDANKGNIANTEGREKDGNGYPAMTRVRTHRKKDGPAETNADLPPTYEGSPLDVAMPNTLDDGLELFQANLASPPHAGSLSKNDHQVKPDGTSSTPKDANSLVASKAPPPKATGAGDIAQAIRKALFKSPIDGIPSAPRSNAIDPYDFHVGAPARAGLPFKAEEGLRHLLRLYINGDTTFEPNTKCFTRVLIAWQQSKRAEAPKQCHDLVLTMFEHADAYGIRCTPDAVCMKIAIQCWIESQAPDSSNHMGPLFRMMKERYLKGNYFLTPTKEIYEMILTAYARHADPNDAVTFLFEMVDDFSDGIKQARPLLRHFNVIMNMFAKSAVNYPRVRARSVFTRFTEPALALKHGICLEKLRLSYEKRYPSHRDAWTKVASKTK